MTDINSAYKKRVISSILLVVGGYFAFSLADVCSKILQNHYTIYQVLGMSSFIGLIVTSTWLLKTHGWKSFFPANLKLHLVRGLFLMGTAFCLVTSLKTLPLADFYGIIFIMPFIVMMMAVVILKEKVGWRRWSAAGVAFLGILIIAGPQFNDIGVGIVFALMGAFFSACNVISLRKIGVGQPIPLLGVYPFVFILGMSISGMIITGDVRPIQPADIGWIMLHGPSVIAGIIGMSLGFAKAPETAIVAPFNYTQIIWGILLGWVLFDALPTATTWVGLSLVVAAGLYSIWREYQLAHLHGR